MTTLATLVFMAGPVTAQTFTVLHSFTAATTTNGMEFNSDGVSPQADLTLSSNTLYGTAMGGGSFGLGTVFAVNTDGTGFKTLHNFTTNGYHYGPSSGVILSENTLYGTAFDGVDARWAVFKLGADGTGFITFDYVAGGMPYPEAGVILSGNTLYGTTPFWPLQGYVMVFAANTGGGGFTTLHTFNTASEGSGPVAKLMLSGNTLYGTARYGGSWNNGTVFRLNTDGTAFSVLHSFTNVDGSSPWSSLVLSANTLYGTAMSGGESGYGTVFCLGTNGAGFTTLHSFTGSSDGARPYGGLVISGNTLYGTTYCGGISNGNSGYGTVFKLNTDGSGFTTLHTFAGGSDGYGPFAGLALSANALYGTVAYGGVGSHGTVFSLSFLPQLTISHSPTAVVLSWPTDYAGFDYTRYILQSTTNLASPTWTAVSPAPGTVNGQNTVTNAINGTQQFFRLCE